MLGLRFWSVQETEKLLLADALYQQRSKDKIATRAQSSYSWPSALVIFANIPVPKVAERKLVLHDQRRVEFPG